MTAQAALEIGTVPLQATYNPSCHYCHKRIGGRPCRLQIPPDKDRTLCARCYSIWAVTSRMIIDGLFRVPPP